MRESGNPQKKKPGRARCRACNRRHMRLPCPCLSPAVTDDPHRQLSLSLAVCSEGDRLNGVTPMNNGKMRAAVRLFRAAVRLSPRQMEALCGTMVDADLRNVWDALRDAWVAERLTPK